MTADDPLPLPEPRRRTITVTIAEIVLGLLAFPATFVGLTLVWGQLTAPELPESARSSPIPAIFLAYGVATAIAFVAERRRARWALLAALASQLPWIAGMLWAYVAIFPDWSFLVAAALAAAASVAAVLVHLSRARHA